MNPTDVIVVGAGPTGLMLACELALAGVRCQGAGAAHRAAQHHQGVRGARPHPRAARRPRPGRRAGAPRRRGARGATGARCHRRPARARHPVPDDPHRAAERHRAPAGGPGPGAGRSRSYGAPRSSACGRTPTGSSSTSPMAASARPAYVVGADGAHSTVRGLIGVDFVGSQYETHIMLADVRLSHPPEEAMFARTGPRGRRDRGAVRRRLVPRHRLGPAARTGPAGRAAADGRDARRLRSHRRHRLRHARAAMELTVPQRAPTGPALPGRPGVPGRRRGPCALPARRAGHEHRHPGRDEPRVEARRRRARAGAVLAARQLRRRAAPRRCTGPRVDRRLQPARPRPLRDPPGDPGPGDPAAAAPRSDAPLHDRTTVRCRHLLRRPGSACPSRGPGGEYPIFRAGGADCTSCCATGSSCCWTPPAPVRPRMPSGACQLRCTPCASRVALRRGCRQ